MNGIKLFSTRYEPRDYYSPRDYYGQASRIAKKYCETHSGIDKEVVYMAASEAAEVYERGGVNTGARFETVVQVKIRTALLNQNKRRALIEQTAKKEEEMIDEKTKAAMIADRVAGMSIGQIAIKYKRNKSSVESNLSNWKRAGLFPPENPKIEEVVKSEQQKQFEAIINKFPEAYPGQISDDDEPKYDEHELEFEKKIEELAAKSEAKPKIIPEADDDFAVGSASYRLEDCICQCSEMPTLELTATSMWESLIDNMSGTLCGLLGAGTVTAEMSYSDIRSKAKATVRTPDGKQIRIRIEEV